MKVKHLSIAIGIILGGLMVWNGASALDWQDEVDVQFTFNPALSISLSSADLIIDELSPNSSANSNEINVTVKTNNNSGYKLFASVGNAQHNYRTLLHTNGTNSFASLDVNSSVSTFPADANTWGYSTNSGTTYSGLPLYNSESDGKEIDSASAATTKATPFLIGARADADQVSGDYSNIINFVAVTNAPLEPPATMQNLNPSLCVTASPTKVVDSRDGEEYTVQRLADGKCWMTENLNLAGGTALSADDTDVTSAYISSFSTSNNLTKTGDTIVLPTSSTSGFDTANYSYVYNTGNKTSNCTSPGCYSYYSWDAATLGSGRSISTNNTDAEQSICPKGWKLPTTRSNTDSTSDFRALMIALGGSSSIQTYSSSTTPTGATMFSALQASPNSFLLAGYYYYGSFYDGGSGYYWSATSSSSTDSARRLNFNSSIVYSAYSYGRYGGFSVRCLLR